MCLDRACGKPVQGVRIEDSAGRTINPQNMTTDNLSLLVNGKAEDFLRSLFLNGKLGEYVQKFQEEAGLALPAPNNDGDGIVVKGVRDIDGKKEEKPEEVKVTKSIPLNKGKGKK